MDMKRFLGAVVLALGFSLIWSCPVMAEDDQTVGGAGFSNMTAAENAVSPESQGAGQGEAPVKPSRPLGSFIKDYAKDYDPKTQDFEEPLVERQDALKGISSDGTGAEQGGSSNLGYIKNKEDFVNPKSVLSK
jgi:hypothetical protein